MNVTISLLYTCTKKLCDNNNETETIIPLVFRYIRGREGEGGQGVGDGDEKRRRF
jgi:hypothetical protein